MTSLVRFATLAVASAVLGSMTWALAVPNSNPLTGEPAAALTNDAGTADAPLTNGIQASLRVTPAILEAGLYAGGQTTSTVTLTNISGTTLDITSSIGPFAANQQVDPNDKSRYETSGWIRVDPAVFRLLPGQSQSVVVIATAPPAAEPGGHYATVLFTAQVPEASGAVSSAGAVKGSVGILDLLTVGGDVKEDFTVEGPIRTQRIRADGKRVKLDFTLRNSGNVHVLPAGSIEIRDVVTGSVTKLPIPTELLLPGTERSYSVDWSGGAAVGIYDPSAEITGGTTPVRVAASGPRFVVISPVILAAAGLALFVLVLLGVLGVRRRRRRRPQQKT